MAVECPYPREPRLSQPQLLSRRVSFALNPSSDPTSNVQSPLSGICTVAVATQMKLLPETPPGKEPYRLWSKLAVVFGPTNASVAVVFVTG